MKAFLVFTLTETSSVTSSYAWIFLIWSINYYILKISRYTNIVYIGRYLALTYIERFISTICCFFSYICWSVNWMSWISKFKNFFLACTETEARFIFEDFNIVLCWKFISDSPMLFLFFIWSVNCLRDFFSHFVSQ